MTIKTLSIANVNIGSKPDFPNGLTVSSGNVGIGTRTASYPLDVQSAASGASTAQRLLVNSSLFTFASGAVTVNTAAKTGLLTITSAETYTLSLIYSGMILTATAGTGNLGTMVAGTYVTVTGTSVNGSNQLVISYSYPGGTDPVEGNVTAINVSGYVAGWGPSLLFTGGGASVDLASISGLVGTSNSNTDGYLAFNTRSSGSLAERMRITASGNVGIGTTSPEEVLHVKGTSQWVQPIIDSSPSTTGGSSVVLRGNQNSWALSSRSSANGTTNNGFSIYETLAANIRFVIQTGGNVGIGTTSPAATLHVLGTVAGAVAPRAFIPALALSTPTSNAAVASDAGNGQYQLNFGSSTNLAYAYLPIPSNYAGGNITARIYGSSATFAVSVNTTSSAFATTTYGTSVNVTGSTASPTAVTIATGATAGNPMSIKIDCTSGSLYGILIVFGE